MPAIWDIGLQALEIITFVVGILGITASILLLISPKVVMAISNVCNCYIDLDRKMSCLDKTIRIDNLIYQYNFVSGACLIFGSAFMLVYLYYRLDEQILIGALFGSVKPAELTLILVNFLILIGKFASIVGILAGSILLFNPSMLKAIESKLNVWFATDPLIDKLDQIQGDIDTIVYKRPIMFGLIGLVTSTLLTVLAFNNIMS